MGRKKQNKQMWPELPNTDGLCHPNGCIFFSFEPEVLKDEIKDGVRQRKIKRRLCLFDMSVIDTWNKACPYYECRRRLIEARKKEQEESDA